MSLSVDFSKWHVRRGTGELTRIYHFSGLQAPNTTATLRLDCRLESAVGGNFIHPILTLYFRPFRLVHETSLVMGLVTADQSKGRIVEVRACSVEGERDSAVLTVGLGVEGRQDVQKCLSAISSGKEMFFMLGDQTRPFVKLPLPNDGEFQRLYSETYERMARAQDASRDGFYLKRFLRGVGGRLGATTRQRSFAADFKDGRRLLAKTALDTFTRLKVTTFGLTKGYAFPDKISAMAERLNGRTWARAVARVQDASRNGFYLKRFLRGVGGRLGAATTRQQTDVIFTEAFKRLLAETDELIAPDPVRSQTSFSSQRPFLDTAKAHRDWVVFGVCALAGVVVIFAWIGSSNIQSTSSSKPSSNSWASPAGPTQATANVKMQAETATYLRGPLDVANKEQPKQEQTSAPAEVHPVTNSGPLDVANKEQPKQEQTSAPAEVHSVTNSGPLDVANKEQPKQEQTNTYLRGLLDVANKEQPKQEQTPAPAEVHPVMHAIGEVGTLKQTFVGCRDSWQGDGSLELESKSPANQCDVRLPAGTKVIVANMRANNNICLRFPDDIVCYWATGDVLKPPKLVPPTPTEVHPVKSRPAKAHPVIRRRDDDQLNFLVDRYPGMGSDLVTEPVSNPE